LTPHREDAIVTRIAAIQAEPVWLDTAATMKKTVELIRRAAHEGADLIVFPEVWLPGYPVFLWSYPVYQQGEFVARYHAQSLEIDGPEIAEIRAAAAANATTVVVGFSERAGGSLYIAQIIIGPQGDVLLHRRKLKPTHVERSLFGESDGSGLKVISTPLGRLGALNCAENIQPLTKYAMYAQDEQLHIAAWPCLGIMGDQPALSPESIMAASQTYALEGGVFVVTSSQIMSEEGARVFPDASGGPTPIFTGGGGYARVYGPNSGLLTEPLDPHTEGIVYADIDLADIAMAKNAFDPAGHYARPDVTRLVFDNRPHQPVTLAADEPARPPIDLPEPVAPRETAT
jgi:aliphatic nitrilase